MLKVDPRILSRPSQKVDILIAVYFEDHQGHHRRRVPQHGRKCVPTCQGSNRKSNRSRPKAQPKSARVLDEKKQISPRTNSQGHYSRIEIRHLSYSSVFGKPRSNTNLPTRHGRQRFYWPWRRRGLPWITRCEVYGNR